MKSYLILPLFLLYSCSAYEAGKIAPGYKEAFIALKGIIIGYDNEFLTRQVIDEIPFASLVLRIGKGAPGLMILESVKPNEETWVSADGVYVLIRDGRIIKTAGLENNLSNFLSIESSMKDFIAKDEKVEQVFYYSYDVPRLIDLKVTSVSNLIGKEKINIYDIEKELFKIEEIITNEYLGWSVKNYFWVDQEGFIWKSEQNISPKMPTFYLEVTRKPAI